ncbi:CsbD family protein [Desulfuromonas sp. AOP6]|uniref:CsbD family protein n=1 Tax=Desulfuromonas sp. AOP6 TaxID=1566351 RepID=UPI00126B0065|nr:CsbD family protein [Desulfuromonas sp. AOP6]BCA79304.1 CsbD family protein [Desulfuromonas sp. AOP6]
MDNKEFKARWHQLRGLLKGLWGELSGNDIDFIDGQRERLVGKLQEKYNLSEKEAQRKVDELSDHL